MTLFESLLAQRRPPHTYRKVRGGKRLPLYRLVWCTLCTPTTQRGLPGGNKYNSRNLEVSYNLHPSENNTCLWSLFNFSCQGHPSLRNLACLQPSMAKKQTENNKEQVVPYLISFGRLIVYRRLGFNAFFTSFDSCSADDKMLPPWSTQLKRSNRIKLSSGHLSYTKKFAGVTDAKQFRSQESHGVSQRRDG